MSDNTISDDATIISEPPEDDLEVLRRHLKPKYTVEKKLGSGGMADVYLGFHTQLKRKVAIKVLPRMFTRDEAMVQRFLQEAESAAQLDHPNIISIYDIGVADGLNYFIMAFVPGNTLKTRLKVDKRIDVSNATVIIRQICSALHYAHGKGVIHRDIKPDNIMFDEHKNAILTDFGIAKAKFASKMTATGTLIGTPHYMSPEQLKGKEIDGRSDIYSLGIMFYEILTGRVPFEGEDTYSVGLKHIQEPPVPPLELNPQIPESINNVILTMLAKVPEARFQNAADVSRAVEAAMRGEDFTSGDVTVSERAKVAVDTWRGDKETVQAQFREMEQALGPKQADRTVARAEKPAPERTVVRGEESMAKKKSNTPLFIGIAAVVVIVIIGVIFAVTQSGGSQPSGPGGGSGGGGSRSGPAANSTESYFEDLLDDYGLVYMLASTNGIEVHLLEKEDGDSSRYFAERPEIGQTAVDMDYNERNDRFLIEQEGGSLVSVNSTGYDEILIELSGGSGDSWPKTAAWSGDGSRIAFVRTDNSGFALVIAEISEIGTVEATYTPYTSTMPLLCPRFMPDDTSRIYFGQYEDDGSTTVMLLTPENQTPNKLTNVPGLLNDFAFGEDVAGLVTLTDENYRVFLWTLSGDEMVEIERNSDLSGRVAFTHDGEYLVYAIKENGEYVLAAIKVDNPDERYIFPFEAEGEMFPMRWVEK